MTIKFQIYGTCIVHVLPVLTCALVTYMYSCKSFTYSTAMYNVTCRCSRLFHGMDIYHPSWEQSLQRMSNQIAITRHVTMPRLPMYLHWKVCRSIQFHALYYIHILWWCNNDVIANSCLPAWVQWQVAWWDECYREDKDSILCSHGQGSEAEERDDGFTNRGLSWHTEGVHRFPQKFWVEWYFGPLWWKIKGFLHALYISFNHIKGVWIKVELSCTTLPLCRKRNPGCYW